MPQKVLVPLADGVEEMEAVIIMDTLRRGGLEVSSATPDDISGSAQRTVSLSPVTGSRGVGLMPDVRWNEITHSDFDVIAIPGGLAGVTALCASSRAAYAVRGLHHRGKICAAVCAGPLVLQASGILKGRTITCHPSVTRRITQAQRIDKRIVVDGGIITSQGPGTALDFALTIVACVAGPAKAETVAEEMIHLNPDYVTGPDS
ncbi:MAG: DJ-1/PfpI family protein [Kiritimatiellia bacterium]